MFHEPCQMVPGASRDRRSAHSCQIPCLFCAYTQRDGGKEEQGGRAGPAQVAGRVELAQQPQGPFHIRGSTQHVHCVVAAASYCPLQGKDGVPYFSQKPMPCQTATADPNTAPRVFHNHSPRTTGRDRDPERNLSYVSPRQRNMAQVGPCPLCQQKVPDAVLATPHPTCSCPLSPSTSARGAAAGVGVWGTFPEGTMCP